MFGDRTTRFHASAAYSTPFVRRLVEGIALVNLLIFGVLAFSLYQSLVEAEDRAELMGQNLSLLLAQDISGYIGKIDLTLLASADEIERQLAHGSIDTQAINSFLERQQGRIPNIFSLRMSDANGIVLYGRGVNPAAHVTNSDREYFVRQRDNPKAGLVIGKPIVTRIDGKWAIPFSRAIHLPDGSFGGVVYINVAMEHFVEIFSAVDAGSRGSVSLRDAELRIFARYPMPADAGKVIGEPLLVPELEEIIRAGRAAGTYVTNRTVDGVERRFAVHKLSGYPLYIVVGRSTEEYMVRWRKSAVNAGVLAALFCLTTVFSSWLIFRNWRRRTSAMMELAREKEEFHTVADYTYDWEYWVGPEQEILLMSPSCERVTGYTQSEFQADPELLYRIVHPDDLDLMTAHRRDEAHADEAAIDFRIVRRDGKIRWIAHGCRDVFGQDGKFMGRRASNRDITERKEAQDKVNELNRDLEQQVAERTAQLELANKELEAFSYSVSHDLRAPLRAIEGFSHILQEDYAARLDDEAQRLLGVVRDNTKRMNQLIDDILNFSRAGRVAFTFSEIDMEKMAHAVVDELQPSIAGSKLQLDIEHIPPARGDSAMMYQVFVNLLSNAIKFSRTKEFPRIQVGATTADDETIYYVRDNGAGFNMQYADKLFGVFQRLHTINEFEGTGIGLSIVKRIITRHGGRVWAEGKINEGATIYFALPAKA